MKYAVTVLIAVVVAMVAIRWLNFRISTLAQVSDRSVLPRHGSSITGLENLLYKVDGVTYWGAR